MKNNLLTMDLVFYVQKAKEETDVLLLIVKNLCRMVHPPEEMVGEAEMCSCKQCKG
jgi:hypothetical protein